MILHVSSVSDVPGSKARVSFVALNIAPPPPTGKDGKPIPQALQIYPGYVPVGNFQVMVAEGDAAIFTRGARFDLTPIQGA